MTGCAPSSGPSVRTKRLDFADLDGWAEADHASAASVFRASLDLARASSTLGVSGEDWRGLSARLVSARFSSARSMFEALFTPVQVETGSSPLITGYYEPEVRGASTPSSQYRHPIYTRPADLGETPYHDRAAIVAGALAGRGLELYWLDDAVDAFFLHIQGSGRVRLAEGGVARVGYAGKNNHPYVAIGRRLVERGEMTVAEATADAIKDWLRDRPEAGAALMNENPSFVFFEDRPQLRAEDGPVGALGVPLAAGVSIAVDPAFHPLGAPVWVETANVALGGLKVAQDVGGAIKGAQRADLYIGSGDEAGLIAGRVRSTGRLATLIPTMAAERLS
ncbi:MAG: MltA domain-containing protein [Pseudomonadota bacterium]